MHAGFDFTLEFRKCLEMLMTAEILNTYQNLHKSNIKLLNYWEAITEMLM